MIFEYEDFESIFFLENPCIVLKIVKFLYFKTIPKTWVGQELPQ